MTITKCTSTVNTTYKINRGIKYIVIHYTAGTSSKAGSAVSTAKYFASGKAGGSADFIVDNATFVQYNPDIKNRYCWAVGGSKYTTMSTSEGGKYYGKCTNANSISIEMCSNKTNTKSKNASDTDWYLTDDTVTNAVELTKYLMSIYNISADCVIMHHHVTGKICPNPWCVSEDRLLQWDNFKSRLTATKTATETKSFKFIDCTVKGKACKFTGFTENSENWIMAKSFLEVLGYTVGWDSVKKRVIVKDSNYSKLLDIRTYISADNKAFCPIRDIATAVGLTVSYNAETKAIVVS